MGKQWFLIYYFYPHLQRESIWNQSNTNVHHGELSVHLFQKTNWITTTNFKQKWKILSLLYQWIDLQFVWKFYEHVSVEFFGAIFH